MIAIDYYCLEAKESDDALIYQVLGEEASFNWLTYDNSILNIGFIVIR